MKVLLLNASPKDTGATQEIARIVQSALPKGIQSEILPMKDVEFSLCIGCKRCYETGDCFRRDGVQDLLHKIDAADAVVIVCPSWWADVPAQFKGFIDRCTPYADTAPDNGHFRLHKGIRCYGIALRAGTRTAECDHILQCIEHYFGHMGIQNEQGLSLTGIDKLADVEPHIHIIQENTQAWFA